MANAGSTTIFEPDDVEELLRGWLLPAHKARARQDEAARRDEKRRDCIGAPAVAFSAIAGTSVVASINNSPSEWVSLLIGLLGISAAVLAGLQTFLDYPTRLAQHHAAGTKYKAIIRELEQVLVGSQSAFPPTLVSDVRERLDELEAAAPVVPSGIWNRVEKRYANVTLVGRAVGQASATS
jgi:hypothetical protein